MKKNIGSKIHKRGYKCKCTECLLYFKYKEVNELIKNDNENCIFLTCPMCGELLEDVYVERKKKKSYIN